MEIPSDFAGVVYTEMDDRGAWKTELLRELQARAMMLIEDKVIFKKPGGPPSCPSGPLAPAAVPH